MKQSVLSTHRGTPVHTRYRSSKDDRRNGSLPPTTRRERLEDEEHGQRHSTGSDSNDSSPDDICWFVNALVVFDGSVGQVVHTADGTAAKDTSSYHSPPGDSIRDAYRVECGKEDNNRHAEGEYCHATGVYNLHLCLAFSKRECDIANEMLHHEQY